MCHDPSMKMFLEGGLLLSLLLFLCASMACGMETRLLLEVEADDDADDDIASMLVLVEEMDCLNLSDVAADVNRVRVRVNP
jgi:hypothetical protein